MKLDSTERGAGPAAEPVDVERANAENEARLQCIIELSADYYWEQDEQHRFTLIRQRDLGRTEDGPWTFLGKAAWELDAVPMHDGPTWDAHKALRDAREPFDGFLIRHTDASGEQRYLSVSGRPVFDRRGEFRGYRGMARDVTLAQQRERLLALERNVMQILADNDDISKALTAAIRAICEVEGWEAGQYWSLDAEAGAMRLTEVWSAASSAIQAVIDEAKQFAMKPGMGLVGVVWRSAEPLWIADLTEEKRVLRKHIMEKTGWKSALLFPVLLKGRVIGVLDFNARHIPRPDNRLLQVLHVLGTQIGNFHQRSMALEQLRASEERFWSTIELAAIGISHVGKDGRFVHVNRQLCEMLGYTRKELLKLTVKAISHPDDVNVTDEQLQRLRAGEIDSFRVEKRYLRKDGAPIWVRLAIARKCARDGTPEYDISVVEDISERKRAEDRVQYLATHDELTGVPNRAMFGQLLHHAIEAARRRSTQFAVLFIDLDRFKNINDSLGHEAGDRLLKEMAVRLRQSVRASDVVARLGGDEFVVILEPLDEPAHAGDVARKILSAVLRPVQIMGQECRVTASIGIAMFPEDADDEPSLMRHADMAMYFAKEEGKNNCQFYSREITSLAIERLALETQLRGALERNELLLQYQPKIDLKTGEITGVEALLRWWNFELGTVPPAQFIPVAEDTGLIVPIGKWVLKTACEQNVAWQRRELPPVAIAVNLSPRQFKDPQLLDDIAEILEHTRMRPELLELEITEGMIMSNMEQAIERISAIKNLGVKLAIDDFGTGYSSLSQLKRFPIDTLKVDRSFIRDIPDNAEDKAITEAIIAMGRALGVTIVAEGVETEAQQSYLRDRNCNEMQGYYFAEPCHPDKVAALLGTHP